MYQIEGKDVLFDWLAHEPDPTIRQNVLDWMAELAEEPHRYAFSIPGVRPPVYFAVVPGKHEVLRFLLAEQFHVLKLIRFSPLP